jgi:hypothetical protein
LIVFDFYIKDLEKDSFCFSTHFPYFYFFVNHFCFDIDNKYLPIYNEIMLANGNDNVKRKAKMSYAFLALFVVFMGIGYAVL